METTVDIAASAVAQATVVNHQASIDTLSWSKNLIMGIMTVTGPYIPFTIIIGIIVFVLYLSHNKENTPFLIEDLVVDHVTKRGSLEKVLMLTGGLCAVWWFIGRCAAGLAGFEDMMALTTVLGLSKAWNSWLGAKYKTDTKAE